MRKNLLLILFILFISGAAHAQLSGYVKEGFEGSTFPPTGWQTVNVTGDGFWRKADTIFHSGLSSAFITYDPILGEDWLISPQFTVAATDQLEFWMAPRYVGFPPDKLYIEVSTTDASISSFTKVILKLEEGVNYPTSPFAWQKYSVSLSRYAGQNIYLAFKHSDANGDGVFVDDVTIGTPPANDISTLSINVNKVQGAGRTITPTATFRNEGSKTHTFDVKLLSGGTYSSVKTVTALQPGFSKIVTFDDLTIPATAGNYGIRAYSSLHDDADHTNDTLQSSIKVYGTFANMGWVSAPQLTTGAEWAMGTAAWSKGTSPDDTAYITTVSGSTENFIFSNAVSQFNTKTNTWSKLAPVPQPRLHGHAFYYNGKIFYIGGYHPNFAAVREVSIYDVATDKWSSGVPMPEKAGDFAACQYQDSLIYVIGGYSGFHNGDKNEVQIYNAASNTWSIGTRVTGIPCGASRAGVAGNKIVVVGGYSQALGTTLDQAYMGTIDASNPANITWTKIANYPGGTDARLVGTGVSNSIENLVYFTGGDPTGAGTDFLTGTWAYDVDNNEWKIGPDKPTGVSNIVDFAPFVYDDTVYIASVGGYGAAGPSRINEWLKLGPTSTIGSGKFIHFAANLSNGKTMLNWKAAENGSVVSYTVQRSTDAVHFTDMAEVPAGKTVKTVSYDKTDMQPGEGFTFYRIKMTYKKSQVAYSEIRAVKNEHLSGMAAVVYPNPSHGLVNLALKNNTGSSVNINIKITDLAGKILKGETKHVDNSLNVSYILRSGTYIIQMQSEDGKWNQSQKLIVD